jgi:regulator of sigma E protease
LASIFWFIVLVGVLIFAHEGGHFLLAKAFRVKVITFSLGFGTPIRIGRWKLSRTRGETEYRLAWFPIGGFVRMLGDDPSEPIPPEEQARAFSTQKVWKRFFIIFAGPAFSIALAVPIFFIYHLFDTRAPAPVVGRVIGGSPAEKAGLLPGDRLLALDGRPLQTWEDLDEYTQKSQGRPVRIELERGGKRLSVEVTPYPELDDTGLEIFGRRWELGLRHERRGPLVGVIAGSAAERAGLRSWDQPVRIAGVPVEDWEQIRRMIEGLRSAPFTLEALRASVLEAGAVELVLPAVFSTLVFPQAGGQDPGLEPIDLYVKAVAPGQPAEKNGVQPGDRLLELDGERLGDWEQFSRLLAQAGERTLRLTVRSGSELRSFEFSPATIEQTNEFRQRTSKRGLGVSYLPNLLAGEYLPRPHRLLHATAYAFIDTGNVMAMNAMGFVRLFQGRVKPSEAIGGPIMIADIAGKSAQKGWRYFVQMMAFLSIVLGMLNLLPIPILDGGHILFLAIEGLTRQPVPLKVRLAAGYLGLVLLAALMIFAFSNDIMRYWPEL